MSYMQKARVEEAEGGLGEEGGRVGGGGGGCVCGLHACVCVCVCVWLGGGRMGRQQQGTPKAASPRSPSASPKPPFIDTRPSYL